MLSLLLHSIGDFERISDHAVNLVQAAREMREKKLAFSDDARKELGIFTDAVREIMELAFGAFEGEDMNLARQVEPLEQVIDVINMEEKQRHILRLRQGRCTIELGFILADVSTNLERVADHCSKHRVCLLQSSRGGFDTHGYLEELKNEEDESYKAVYSEMSRKYRLPDLPA